MKIKLDRNYDTIHNAGFDIWPHKEGWNRWFNMITVSSHMPPGLSWDKLTGTNNNNDSIDRNGEPTR